MTLVLENMGPCVASSIPLENCVLLRGTLIPKLLDLQLTIGNVTSIYFNLAEMSNMLCILSIGMMPLHPCMIHLIDML